MASGSTAEAPERRGDERGRQSGDRTICEGRGGAATVRARPPPLALEEAGALAHDDVVVVAPGNLSRFPRWGTPFHSASPPNFRSPCKLGLPVLGAVLCIPSPTLPIIESLRSFRQPALYPCCHLLRARGDF